VLLGCLPDVVDDAAQVMLQAIVVLASMQRRAASEWRETGQSECQMSSSASLIRTSRTASDSPAVDVRRST
jgi:hypothetical protein